MAGRPTKFDPEYHPEHARKLSLLGFTDEKLAEFFEIDVATLYRWKEKHPEFREAVKRGKVQADGEVAASFYQRATGYEYDSEKIFCTKDGEIVRAETTVHVPADPGAALNWLKNRQPELWRDKRDLGLETQDGEAVAFPVVRIFTGATEASDGRRGEDE